MAPPDGNSFGLHQQGLRRRLVMVDLIQVGPSSRRLEDDVVCLPGYIDKVVSLGVGIWG